MSINKYKSELIQDWYFNSRALNILDRRTRPLKFEDLAKPNSFLNGPKFFFKSYHIGDETFTRYSFFFTRYLLLLLVDRHFLLVTRYFLLVTRYFLLITRYFLLVTCCFLLVTRYFLLATCYFLLVTCYFLFLTLPSLLIAAYLLLVATYSIPLRFIGTILHYIRNNYIKLYVSS